MGQFVLCEKNSGTTAEYIASLESSLQFNTHLEFSFISHFIDCDCFFKLILFLFLLLCWEGVHCGIYKSSYNVSNIS
jgi:hypothetical protein